MNDKPLEIEICPTVEDAPNYQRNGLGIEGADLVRAIIVRNGTEEGDDSIDLQFTGHDGRRYVALTTAKTIKALAGALRVKGAPSDRCRETIDLEGSLKN